MTRINTNVTSLVAQNRLRTSNNSLETSLTRLSTGLRINTGKDDPAGLIASESLRSDITSINKAISNTQRANQVIATADSALGQVSSLLNDIRGLVVEASNSGALSDEEIAANQLQVDSSLEAINRIAQTTTFQGRKLLDGSLDFLTSAGDNFTKIRDLKINQANLGATGAINLDVKVSSAATRARVEVTDIPAAGEVGTSEVTLTNTAADDQASTTITGAGSGAAFDITAKEGTAVDGTAGNDVSVNFTAGQTSADTRATSGVLEATGGDFLIAAKAGGAYDGAAGNDATFEFTSGSTAIAQAQSATQEVNGVANAISVRAVAGGDFDGTDGNAINVVVETDATATGIEVAENAGTLTISVQDNRSYSLQEIKDAVAASGVSGDFEVVLDDGADGVLFRADGSDDLSFGLDGSAGDGSAGEDAVALIDFDAATDAFTITTNDNQAESISDILAALADNEDFAANFESFLGTDGTFADDGTDDIAATNLSGGANVAAEATYADGVLNITYDDSTGRTAADVRAALEADSDFADLFEVSNDSGTFTADGTDDVSDQALTGGTDTTVDDVLTITGPNGEDNNGTVTINTSSTVTTPEAAVDDDGNITITLNDTSASSLADIKAAIDGLDGYSAEITTSDGDGSYDPSTDSITASDITGATNGGITHDVVFELGGRTGSQVFEVSAGTDIDQLISQINLNTDTTGITATKDDSTLVLRSSDYGSKATADLRIIDEDASGTFTSSVGVRARDTGSDVKAKINGVDAKGDGNDLQVKTSALDLNMTLEAGFTGTASFGVNGGGAKFQIGPEVVANQQARIGIGSVNTARLGGANGKLFELANGGAADLATDPTKGAEIVDEAISQVAGLRGRLGAFQSATLESSLVSLTDTVANLTEAESSIRDADFAAESAALTRSQILVQSGTSVLGIANQNPQNVLALLQ